MKVQVELVGYEFEEFDFGRWFLRIGGIDEILCCEAAEADVDQTRFVGSPIMGWLKVDYGEGGVADRDAPKMLKVFKRINRGRSGDSLAARGTFCKMCADGYEYEIDSAVPITASLDQEKPRPTFQPGQWIEFEGDLVFEKERS